MKKDSTTNMLLLLIAIAMIFIAIRPLWAPHAAHADAAGVSPFYIQPGVQNLRSPDGTVQTYGIVAVDLRNGKAWGFPTSAQAAYPVDIGSTKPPVSHPIFLGTFDFGDTDQ